MAVFGPMESIRRDGRSGRVFGTLARDVAPGMPLGAKNDQSGRVYGGLGAADALALRLRCGDTGADAITDQLAFEFRDAGEDAKDEPAVRRARIDPLVQADEIDAERPEVFERVDQLPETAGEAVLAVNHDDINPAPAAIGQEATEGWAPFLGATDALVHVLARDLPAAAVAVGAQLAKLHLGVLAVIGGNARVQGRAGLA